MKKPIKSTVYLPANSDYLTAVCHFEHTEWCHHETVQSKEGYFFTPKQLNEYTSNVIKQALETAADKVYALVKDHDLYIREYVGTEYSVDIDMSEGSPLQYGCSVITDKESITNTFEEIYKLFKNE